ncbi:MAG: DUF4342 domain-containing protein [Dehalococcoidia bacterium]
MAQQRPEQSLVGRSIGWLKEQHARRFIVEKDGRVAVELPLTVFVIGVVMAPHVAILGIVLAFITRHEVHVESPADAPDFDEFGEAEAPPGDKGSEPATGSSSEDAEEESDG